MLIDEGLDTGPTLLARATPDRTGGDGRRARAAARPPRGGGAPGDVRGLVDGTIAPVPQDHARATLAPLLKKEDGRIDWSRPAASSPGARAASTPGPAPSPATTAACSRRCGSARPRPPAPRPGARHGGRGGSGGRRRRLRGGTALAAPRGAAGEPPGHAGRSLGGRGAAPRGRPPRLRRRRAPLPRPRPRDPLPRAPPAGGTLADALAAPDAQASTRATAASSTSWSSARCAAGA
jgi:hypothetical protein